MDEITFDIENLLIEDTSVGGRTHGRVYKGDIKGVPQPAYPCVTVQRQQAGEERRYAPLQSFPILISTFSNISYDEAFWLHTAIKNVLHQKAYTDAAATWVAYRRFPPIQSAKSDTEVVYIAHAIYDLQAIL